MSEILKGNLLYGQGGGPTSILNTSAYELFKEAFKHENRSYFQNKNNLKVYYMGYYQYLLKPKLHIDCHLKF